MSETNYTTRDTRREQQRGGDRLLVITVIAVVLVFVLFSALLWKLGFFSFTGSDPSSKVVAAAISLVGGLIGALITLIGLVLKHSIDQRNLALQEQTAERARIEFDRNNRLAEDAERRLKVEAAIQAIGLLGSNSGHEVPVTQRAGVLLTLGDLGMLPLALSLAEQMLSADKLDSGTATWLFNKALMSDDADVQAEAALLTGNFAGKMLLPGGNAAFPALLLKDKFTSLPEDVRRPGAFAIIDLILQRPFSEWAPGVFFSLLDSLHFIWKHEPDEYIRTNAGAALRAFFRAYEPEQIILLRNGPQLAGEVLGELSEYDGIPLDGRMHDGKLRSLALLEWSKALKQGTERAGMEHGAAAES